MAVKGCLSNSEISRVDSESLSPKRFDEEYFCGAKPVIITGATKDWPCSEWTIKKLVDRVGANKVSIRGKTNKDDYRSGKAYTIRQDTFANYCSDVLAETPRAKESYLAVASLQQAFPELLQDVPLPKYLRNPEDNEASNSKKLHLGPYMWVALKGHYEFCHFDPDDNFLVMVEGRKQVRLFGYDTPLQSMYPNPLGSHGKTIQSQVDLDEVDLEKFPMFGSAAHCYYGTLCPGEMLFVPAFYWHQVSALDTGISVNMFYGDEGKNKFVSKVLKPPYHEHFKYWLLNIVQQNRKCESFPRMLNRLDEVLYHFFFKQWHEQPDNQQIDLCVSLVREYLGYDHLPVMEDNSKFPPILKIRGLINRTGNEWKSCDSYQEQM